MLSSSQQWNYFHWLFEVLGRLAIAEKAGAKWDRVYVENARPFQVESLAALGIPREQIVDSSKFPLVKCRRLVAPSCPDAFHQPAGWMVDFLRTKFARAAGDPSLIYISREKSSFRRTTNEAEVADYLAGRGFRKVCLEGMPFTEQASLFAGAEAVVATHGAGLANLAFCPPGARVVEIIPPRYCHWVYYRLACRAELRYACCFGEGSPDPELWRYQKENVTADIAGLGDALNSVFR